MAANSKKNQIPVDQSLVDDQLVAPTKDRAAFEAVAKAAAAEDIADALVEPDQEDDELERLVAEQKATAARIKEIKAMQPQQTPLERELAKQQADGGGAWVATVISHRAARRVKYGQPLEAALDEVMHQYRGWVLAILNEAK